MTEQEIIGKRKLLIAADTFLPRWDGIARFLSEMIPRLSEKYDITILAPDYGVYEDSRIRLVKMPIHSFVKIGDFRLPKAKILKINKEVKDADIVFIQSLGPIGWRTVHAAKKFKKPIAAYIHIIEWEIVPKALHNPILKKIAIFMGKKIAKTNYNKCNLLILPTHNISELFLWNNIRTHSEVVHLGVDTNKFIPATLEVKKALRSQLEFKEDDFIIGYHGRIAREKDLMTTFRAFTRLQQKYSNIKLLIVGDGLDSIKKQLSARTNVVLVGSKNNPVPYLQIMDVYCMSSLTETTCLSALEAMSCGLPVISTEVGFIKDYIRNGINGLFFEKQNPYYLAKQVERIMNDKKFAERLGENARKTVVERFSWDKTAKGIIDALETLR